MKRYIIFGSDYCRYCKLAKSFCESNNLEYSYYDINTSKGKFLLEHFQDNIKGKYNFIPKIFLVEESFIGGFEDLYKKHEKSKKKKSKTKKSKKK